MRFCCGDLQIFLISADRELVTPLVFRVAGMALDPLDGDLVLRELREEFVPEVRVQGRFLSFLRQPFCFQLSAQPFVMPLQKYWESE